MMKNENYERYFWIGLALTLVVLGGLVAAWLREPVRLAEAAEEFNQASLRRGRQLYVDNCTACHGTRGEGVVGPALNNKTLLKKASDEILFAITKAGPIPRCPPGARIMAASLPTKTSAIL